MKNVFTLSLFVLLSQHAYSQTIPDKWLTDYEKSGYKKTPRYAETVEFCQRLEKGSPWIKVTSFGKSPQGRDLPLVIVSNERAFNPAKAVKTGKAIVLIQNGIHAGEIDGKDACLMLLRDIAITHTKASLLDHVIFLIIPMYNVDGHERFGLYNRINQNGPEEMGWRVTAQNLNLNRDYMKADALETQAWLSMFNAWLPDFFVDCHVTDGADFQYVVTFAMDMHENVAAPVRTWIKEKFLPVVISRVNTGKVLMQPYSFFFFKDAKDPRKGITVGTGPPRFATQYVLLQNRPALLIETHMLKDYKTRVEGTYRLLEETLRRLNEENASLQSAVRAADTQTAAGLENPFPLQFEIAQTPIDTVQFLGYKSTIEKSDISGGDRIIYTKEPFEADVPRYDSIVVTKAVQPPVAYLIPQQWQVVISRLKLHGVKLERLTSPVELVVESYRFSDAKWQQNPFEGRHAVTYSVEPIKETRTFSGGTFVVWLNQRAARVAIHALEPDAPDAFVRWGFFDAIFEEKEYAEDYIMEQLAREMLVKDPHLKKEFEEKIQTDTAFAKSPSARLHFFYERSPYWDKQVNLYPVARLISKVSLPTEPLK